MIKRPALKDRIDSALARSRIVSLVGPRQCGKTTMARLYVAPDSLNYFDLEDPLSLARLDEPMTALKDLKGLVVIDEVQLRPELFPVLRVLADRQPLPARFLILGSASRQWLRQSSESLAGRMETITLSGFSLPEVGLENQAGHWLRGGLPLSYLAAGEDDSFAWRSAFIRTFLEHDLPMMGIGASPAMLMRFWAMLAHYHAQVWKAAEPARALGVNETTVRRYLDLLDGLYMVRQLMPWHANLKKRQVKAPKVYFRDTGILHCLLGIRSAKDLLTHPKCGASWEGYVIDEAINAWQPQEAYFWATHNGAELDLLMVVGEMRIGIECKRVDAPRVTPSMRTALADLDLDRLLVVYPGDKAYPLSDRVEVVPLEKIYSMPPDQG
ncbi:MAG TPA: ATP-binding protein [Desulfomonilia bacterium]|nr:ATP-binding protein [Desulfomonilia bacterium]